jgi:hypothetical protein
MTMKPASKPKTKLTAHQMEVLRIIIKGNDSPSPELALADLDEVLDRVSRDTSKQSMQFTIRSLVHNGMIVKCDRARRRGRLRVTYKATELGKAVGADRPPVAPSFVESAVESLLAG